MANDNLTDQTELSSPREVTHTAEIFLYCGLIVTGIATTLLGPILPVFMAKWNLTDERAGDFFIAQFCASLAGIALLDPLVQRRGYGAALGTGFASIALGLVGLAQGSQIVALLAAAIMGFGLGLTLSGANLWVAELASGRRAAALSVLNLAWGIGAVASAPLAMLARRNGSLPVLLYSISALAVMSSLVMWNAITGERRRSTACKTPGLGWMMTPRTLILGAMFFLYVGAENSVGGWVAELARRDVYSAGKPWELASLLFWAGLLGGRAIVPVVLRWVPESILLRAGVTVSALGSVAIANAATFRVIALCVVLTGLGMAGVYPLLISTMAAWYGERTRRAGRIMFSLASLGGAVLPWLVGFTSTHARSLRWGLLVPAGACLAIVGLLAVYPSSWQFCPEAKRSAAGR